MKSRSLRFHLTCINEPTCFQKKRWREAGECSNMKATSFNPCRLLFLPAYVNGLPLQRFKGQFEYRSLWRSCQLCKLKHGSCRCVYLLLEYGPSSSSFPLPCSSLSYFPCRLALNSKYKLETITVDKMLTLKFTFKFNPQKCPLPMILLKSHTRQRENKILWCPSEGEKKTTTDYILSVSLSCLYGINH